MSLVCPFTRLNNAEAERPSDKEEQKSVEKESDQSIGDDERKVLENPTGGSTLKCPLGYDSGSFKLGPLSCVICRALLFDSSKCVPCGHKYCKFCISPYKDCPLCGADIESIEADVDLQKMVERFIEGHARIKRQASRSAEGHEEQEKIQNKNVIYEDVSLARGSFLVQQAMRAYQGQNLDSARARLILCADDVREELARTGTTTEICSQLGAVLGMLGDCSRAMGDTQGAIGYYEESVEMLSKLSNKDEEIVHALSVSLNKLGDLKYYANDLQSARIFYSRALDVREKALNDHKNLSSLVLDVSVSLAKVADVDRALGENIAAKEGFTAAVKALEGLNLKHSDEEATLERKRLSILEFLHGQLRTDTEC